MSCPPRVINEEPHCSGTTWTGFVVAWKNADGSPVDLSGADVRMLWVDAAGKTVFDWHLSDPDKPGLAVPDPESGVLRVEGPGVLSAPAGVLRWELKVWLANGEVFKDLAGTLPIDAGLGL